MQTMILNTAVSLPTTSVSSSPQEETSDSQSPQSDTKFANVLSESVNAGKSINNSTAATATQTAATQPNAAVEADASQSKIAAPVSTDSKQDQTTSTVKADGKTESATTDASTVLTNPITNSYDLLMMLLQTSSLSAAMSTVPVKISTTSATSSSTSNSASPATSGNSLQNVGGTATQLSAQAALLQLLAQADLPAGQTATPASDIKTALTALTAQGDLTTAQISTALTQINKLLQEKSGATTAQVTENKQVGNTAAPLAANITTQLTPANLANNSLLTNNTTVSQQAAASETVSEAATSMLLNGKQSNDKTAVQNPMKQTAVNLSADSAVTTVQVPQAAVNQSQEVPETNPVLVALQGQLSGKLTLDNQVSSNKPGLKAASTTDESKALTAVENILTADKSAASLTTSQENKNSFQFGANQLLQSASDGKTNSLTDTTIGNFSQVLGSVQNQSTPTMDTSATSTTVGKDSLQVVQQIVDQAKLITRDQNTEMVIKLKPDNLGELTLKVTVEQGLVNATFHSDNSEVRAAIQSSLPQLKQDLINSGLKIDNVGVYAGLNQFTSNQQQNSSPQPQLKFSRKEAADNFDDVAQLANENQVTSADGVDYRI